MTVIKKLSGEMNFLEELIAAITAKSDGDLDVDGMSAENLETPPSDLRYARERLLIAVFNLMVRS